MPRDAKGAVVSVLWKFRASFFTFYVNSDFPAESKKPV
jgi:hypothetical protein